MSKRKLSDEERRSIRELREQGLTNRALAEQFGVSIQTIIRTCRPDLYKKNLESNKKYHAKNTQQIYQTRKANAKTYKLVFHKTKDAQIIEHLDGQESVQGYIRSLISSDLNSKT